MTRKEIQELLNKLNAELSAEIQISQQSLKDARSITTKLSNLLNKATGLTEKLENLESGADNVLSSTSKKSSEISDMVLAASNSLQTIKSHLVDITSNISEMEDAYEGVKNLSDKVQDPNTGVEALLAASQQHKQQIEQLSNTATALEAEIRQHLDNVQQNITDMDSAYSAFSEVKQQIDDSETGLTATLEEARTLKDDIQAVSQNAQTIFAEITRYKDQAAKNIASIEAIKSESSTSLEVIKQNEVDSEETKERISKIFELVSQTGHANYFDSRRKKLIYASWAWLVGGAAAIILAIILAIYLLLPLFPAIQSEDGKITYSQDVEIGVLILRASIITPVIAFALYSLNQYGKERRLAEQYAFKSVSASTIEGSIALVERSLKSVPSKHLNTQLADFAITTAHSLHAEPQELQKVTRFSFNAGNNLAKVGGEISDTLEVISKDIQKATGRNSANK